MPDSAIIVLSEVDQSIDVIDALRAGAVGYLSRYTPLVQIREVILQVLTGGACLSPAVTRKITDYFRLEEQPDLYALTNREKQIVICLTEGFSYKLIAFNLGLSLDTVRFHLRNIYKKLQVNSKAEVIAKVMKREYHINL
jgi:DNA-binding NarL/FixJ family response regulator